MTPIRKSSYKPRFNMDSVGSGTQTATLKELLVEINLEAPPSINGTEVTVQTLKPLLRCVERITGRRISGLSDPLPIASLKALKALHTANKRTHAQLFQLIDPPYRGGRATFEARTTGRASRATKPVRLIQNLLRCFRTAVDPKRLARIDQVLLTRSQVLECIARDNAVRAMAIREDTNGDLGRAASAWSSLADWTGRYQVECQHGANDLIESLYTYLRNFEFFHHVAEYPRVQRLAKIARPIHSIHNELRQFCANLAPDDKRMANPTTPVLSLASMPSMVERNAAALAGLVRRCTGLPVRRDALSKLSVLASKMLDVYHLHAFGRAAAENHYLAVADIVAAFCTIRYQQHAKVQYKPYWRGQTDQGTNVLRHLHRERSLDELHRDDYIPEGVSHILYSQFNQFYGAIAACGTLLDGRLRFEHEYLKKYSECLQSNDIDRICTAIRALDQRVDDGIACEVTWVPVSLADVVGKWIAESPT